VEVFENKVVNNISVGTGIISYFLTENPINDKTYKPYPSNIAIHNNTYERPEVRATSKGRFGKMFRFKLKMGKDVPHIMYDGIEDTAMKDRGICIHDNENESFLSLDAEHGFKARSRDITKFKCEGVKVTAVELARN
jgi:hypothetical protein